MAIVTIKDNTGFSLGEGIMDLDPLVDQIVLATVSTWIIFHANDGSQEVWTGAGFTYDATGMITGGIATKVEGIDSLGNTEIVATGLSWNFAILGYPTSELDLLTGADTINAGGGDDFINGGTGNNTINGGSGFDTVDYSTETGKVTVNLGAAATVIATIAAGASTPAHTDSLTGIEAIKGGGGNDVITGSAGNNTLSGGAGFNALNGGAGFDTVDFSDLSVSLIGSAVALNLGSGGVTVAGVAKGTAINFESVTGSVGNDTFTGNALANTLNGGMGADTLIGGAGNDTYVVDNVGDVVTEIGADASDTVRVETIYSYSYPLISWSVPDYTLGANIENLVLAFNFFSSLPFPFPPSQAFDSFGSLAFKGTGNSLNNTITVDESAWLAKAKLEGTGYSDLDGLLILPSSPFNTVLDGRSGNDTLIGGSGKDTLIGGSGADVMKGGFGSDTYIVDSVADVVVETTPNDPYIVLFFGNVDTVLSSISLTNPLFDAVENVLLLNVAVALNATGNASDNTMTGNAFNNSLTGGLGNDTLRGGDGADTLNGGEGYDVLDGGQGDDILTGGNGIDTADYAWVGYANLAISLSVAVAQNTLAAGTDTLSGIENIRAGSGSDTLIGSGVTNSINGGAGNDLINGLAGSDVLTGGFGIDRFVLGNKEAFAHDLITDFTSGADKILLKQAGGLGSIGNGDAVVNGAIVKASAGGFLSSAELVIFTNQVADATSATQAAVAVGSATTAFAIGAQRIFVVDGPDSTGVYLFTSSAADALVSAPELTLLGNTNTNNALAIGDYLFA